MGLMGALLPLGCLAVAKSARCSTERAYEKEVALVSQV